MTTTNSKARKSKTISIDEAAKLMGIKRSSASARLAALGYTQVCSRCGGSGRYSWNQINGDTCFGCSGNRKMLAPLNTELVAEAMARIAAGELDAYFAENKARNAVKKAVQDVQATWQNSAISKAYTALSRDRNVSAAECISSAEFRAQGLLNKCMDVAWSMERSRLSGMERMAIIDEMHANIRAITAAWVAWRG